MGEDTIAAIIVLAIFAVVFLPLGICPLVYYYRLTHGLTVTATVAEHVYSPERRDRDLWFIKVKYFVNGLEYINDYNVCKKRDYLEAHPVGTEIKILVNVHNPKIFILPEDKWILMLMGGMFTPGGIVSLIAVIKFWIN